jgi:hypothetical protein
MTGQLPASRRRHIEQLPASRRRHIEEDLANSLISSTSDPVFQL